MTADQPRELVDGGAGPGHGIERGARVGQHRDTDLGQAHRAGRAIEQILAELSLEPADLCADPGLRDVDALRGAGEVRLLGDGDEVLELPKLHNDDASDQLISCCAYGIEGLRSRP